MFLQASVILLTGCLPQCMLGSPLPPRADTPQEQTLPPEADTPRSRHPPPTKADTLQSRHPREQTPPPKQTPAYGQRAAGTHPTGMHSC